MAATAIHRLSLACAVLAAIAILALALLVVTSIVTRLLGIYIGGLTEGAGYCMAAAGSLGLAYTFLQSEHIRVDLLLARLPAGARLRFEQAAIVVTAAIASFLAWFMVRMVVISWQFGDISGGSDALPLWLPQLPIAAGFCVFALVMCWAAVFSILKGRTPVEEKTDRLLDGPA